MGEMPEWRWRGRTVTYRYISEKKYVILRHWDESRRPAGAARVVVDMVEDGIPDNVRQFLFEHVDSVEQLEVLLLLRHQDTRSWSAAEVSHELRTNTTSVEKRLNRLAALNLLEADQALPPSFRYRPRSNEERAMIDALSEAHRIRRHKVYELIFSPLKRARNFAEAFAVRRLPNDGGEGG